MASRWDTLSVYGSDMRCYVTAHAGSGETPGVLICMHAPGVDGFIRGIADRLAESGLAAIAPDLFHRQAELSANPLENMARLRDDEILRDLDAASGHLRAMDEVDAARTGVIGFCMGGRLAYLFAAADADVRASVVFYGGNILVPWGDGPTPLSRTGEIECPLLGLFGDEDQNPSPDDVTKIAAELARLGKRHEFHSYPGAGHAFLNDSRPSYRAEAAADAWKRCTEFLTQNLR